MTDLRKKNMMEPVLGMLSGFTAGMLISFVCFGMMPFALDANGVGVWFGIGGMLFGVVLFNILEVKVRHTLKTKYLGLVSALLLRLAEGIAILCVYAFSQSAGIIFALILFVHLLMETVEICAVFKRNGVSILHMILYNLLLMIPFVLVGMIGIAVGYAKIPGISSLIIGFAGGTIINKACGEILPEIHGKGRLYSILALICSCFGIVLGMIFTR